MQNLTPVPAHVVNLADHEAEARRVLDNNAWAYFAGGAADELTLRANVQAWQHIQLLPRVLNNLQGGHTQVHPAGRTHAPPCAAGSCGLPEHGTPRWGGGHRHGGRLHKVRAWCSAPSPAPPLSRWRRPSNA